MGLRNKLVPYQIREIGAEWWHGTSSHRVVYAEREEALRPAPGEYTLIFWANREKRNGGESASRNISVADARKKARIDHIKEKYGDALSPEFYAVWKDCVTKEGARDITRDEWALLVETAGRSDDAFLSDMQYAFFYEGVLVVCRRAPFLDDPESPALITQDPVGTEHIDQLVALSALDLATLTRHLH